jgi:hypothetical protein
MDTSKAMVQVIMWTVFIVAVLSVVAAWYLLVGLVTLGIAIAAYWVRKRNAQKAIQSLAVPENGFLSAQQSAIAESAGQLQLVDGSALRVVESSQHNENHRWLAEKYQIERAETLEIPGLVLAGTQWLENEDGGTEKEVLFVVSEDRVLGQLPDVDLADWYDEILEVGGAAKCKLRVSFSSDKTATSIQVLGWSSSQ